MNSVYIFVILFAVANQCTCERNTMTISGVTVSWENLGTKTVFSASSPLGNGVSVDDAWLGIGLNTFKRMVHIR